MTMMMVAWAIMVATMIANGIVAVSEVLMPRRGIMTLNAAVIPMQGGDTNERS